MNSSSATQPADSDEIQSAEACKTCKPRLTKFQKHVLLILRAIGPATYDQVRQHCRKPQGVKKAIYRLRSVGMAQAVSGDRFDIVRIL